MTQKNIQGFPRVSVIIPAYNSEKTIKDTLLSAMQQDYPDIEYVIVNDWSKDNTQKIIESLQAQNPRVILINNPKNFWCSKSRNIGMKQATGDIFAVLDHDDIRIRRDKLSKQVNFLQEHKDVGIVGTNYIIFKNWEYSYKNLYLNDKDIRYHTLRGTQILHSSMVYPRKTYETIWEYNENIKYSEDREYQMRAGKYFNFANLADYAVIYNSHQGNSSHNHWKRQGIDSLLLSLKYCKEYPNALPCITKKILNSGYMFIIKSLDSIAPKLKPFIKRMPGGKKEELFELLEMSIYGDDVSNT